MAADTKAQGDLFFKDGDQKICSKCRSSWPLDHFNKHKLGKNGLNPWCRACLTKKMQAHRARDPESAKAIRRRHYEQNKERVLAVAAIYREKHLAEEQASRAAHYQRNKQRNYEINKAYREANPELYAAAFAKRRASRRNATPAWADLKAVAAIYAQAARTTRETGIVHEVDHIVPLQSKWVCGLHCEANLQVVTGEANRKKHNREWPDMGPLRRV